MAWLPDGKKISKISSFVLAQLNECDRRTDRQTQRAGNSHAYAYHRAAKITIFNQYLALSRKLCKI